MPVCAGMATRLRTPYGDTVEYITRSREDAELLTKGATMFDKALVPCDGSTQLDQILPYVTRFAGGLNMPLVLASVLAPGPAPTLEQRRQEVDHHLHEIVTRLTGA